jgi:hypothetical protein
MLVYVKSIGNAKTVGTQGSSATHAVTTTAPTGRLAEKIAQINKEYDALWDDFEFRSVT